MKKSKPALDLSYLSAIEKALSRSAARARTIATKEKVPYVVSNSINIGNQKVNEEHFEIVDRNPNFLIKVIGIGNAGCNLINQMLEKDEFNYIDFIAIHNDLAKLKKTNSKVKLHIPLAGSDESDVSRISGTDLNNLGHINNYISGADMVFIVSSLGSDLSFQTAPQIGMIAKKLGVLSIAVVSMPFSFEGRRVVDLANTSLAELKKKIDSIITIPNDLILKTFEKNISAVDAFNASNEVLINAISCLSESVYLPGLVGIDFQDLNTILNNSGFATFGVGSASGENRALIASEIALQNPWIKKDDFSTSKAAVVTIKASRSFKMKEFYDVMNTFKSFLSADATVIVSNVLDENYNDVLQVRFVLSGIANDELPKEIYKNKLRN